MIDPHEDRKNRGELKNEDKKKKEHRRSLKRQREE